MAEEAKSGAVLPRTHLQPEHRNNPAGHQPHSPISDVLARSLDHIQDDNDIPRVKHTNQNARETMSNVKCCCGRDECAYIEHNNVALQGLERDLETAAKLGQALLNRHESYVKDSQEEHARLSAYISELENERTSLQSTNEKFVVENRELLANLQALNDDLANSNGEVTRLENLLQDCEAEIRRLTGLARRADELEIKILHMEKDREELNRNVEDGKQESRTALVRWRESERRIRELEKEVEKIEWEASRDRERHEEICARMEKERALERELGLSEGRLKATAAVQNMNGNGPSGKNVVSNFVRDILEDNANLQAGIAELRELLQSSNDEVQNLRDQILQHQPMEEETEGQPKAQSLSDELDTYSQSLPKQVQQEVHVHHHYHAKLGSRKDRSSSVKKPTRRRAVMSSSSGSSTPSMRPQRFVSSPVTPIALCQPHPKKNRWSTQSTATTSTVLSSMASSPRSHFDRNSSIFDRLERDEDSSRPTSPESFSASSPVPWKRKDQRDEPALDVFEEEEMNADEVLSDSSNNQPERTDTPAAESGSHNEIINVSQDLTPKPSLVLDHGSTTPKTSRRNNEQDDKHDYFRNESSSEIVHSPNDIDISTKQHFTSVLDEMPSIRPSIARRSSHESLVSISGMDIHLAQRSPALDSLALLRGANANRHHFSPGPSQARKISASHALASVTEYTAVSRPGLDNQQSASIVALSGIAATPSKRPSQSAAPGAGLGRLVGGWVRSKWGVAPTKSVADLRSASSERAPAGPMPSSAHPSHAVSAPKDVVTATAEESSNAPLDAALSIRSKSSATEPPSSPAQAIQIAIPTPKRAPGINQPGSIPGLAALLAKRTPSEIHPSHIDIDGLKEGLLDQ